LNKEDSALCKENSARLNKEDRASCKENSARFHKEDSASSEENSTSSKENSASYERASDLIFLLDRVNKEDSASCQRASDVHSYRALQENDHQDTTCVSENNRSQVRRSHQIQQSLPNMLASPNTLATSLSNLPTPERDSYLSILLAHDKCATRIKKFIVPPSQRQLSSVTPRTNDDSPQPQTPTSLMNPFHFHKPSQFGGRHRAID
jgi:hypothetical protein